ncbi:hypothetical protein KEM54_006256 [Ascosphaera aggregata]|nr:hypothetical protein KEM54_006256 [Ascosphaera aggregata]
MDRRKHQSIEDHIPIASGIRSGYELRGLDASSYTAQRLQHASPQHLHITSRRTFIGPLPKGWLRMHGKAWYKRLAGFQNYSRQSMTFAQRAPSPGERHELDEEQRAALGSFQACMKEPEQEVDGHEDGDQRDRTKPLGHPDSPLDPEQVGETIELPRHINRTNKADKSTRFGESPVMRTYSTDSGQPTMFVDAPEPGNTVPKSSPCGETMAHGAISTDTDHENAQLSHEEQDSPHYRDSGVSLEQQITPNQADAQLTEGSSPRNHEEPHMQQLQSPSPRTSDSHERQQVFAPPPIRTISPAALEERTHLSATRAEVPSVTDVHPEQKTGNPAPEDETRMTEHGNAVHIGDIVKAERMLARVDTTQRDLPSDYNETYSYGVPVQQVQEWKEYIVVCRRMNDTCSPFQLEFYTHRDIPMQRNLEAEKRKPRYSIHIALDCESTSVNMWSTLDKTIVMWHRNKDVHRTYVMRARSPSRSMEWYTFIRKALGLQRPSRVLVHLPDLNIRILLANMFEHYGRNPHALECKVEAGGLELLRSLTVNPKEAVSKGIIESCLDIMRQQPRLANLVGMWDKYERLGLAWRRYDRLEWVHGANERRMHGAISMEHTHQLELRPRTHYPTCVYDDEKEVVEPSPVEGFLVLLTSKMGRYSRLGRRFSRRLYCNTQNQYLCFSGPASAAPPGPPKLPEVSGMQIPREDIRKEMPLIYDIDPYPLENGTISWLSPGRREIARSYDLEAYRESLRSTRNLHRAEGYFNLAQISEVKKVENPYIPPWWKAIWQSPHEEGEQREEPNPEEGVFELIMRDGLRVRFRAFNSRTRNEWICRLSALVKYWKKRLQEDIGMHRSLRQQNLTSLHISEAQESLKGQYAQKWEISQADASPKVFNICNVSACRPIRMSGTLFCKTRRHNRFERQGLILTDGVLLFFQTYVRGITGRQLSQTYHDNVRTLDLRECYVYSGPITRHDILYYDETSCIDFPRRNIAARIYLHDGWTSSDDSASTTFVIWMNSRKTISHTQGELKGDEVEQNPDGYSRWTRLPALGVKGRTFVFEARSRLERDLWVLALQTEMDRLQEEENVRIVQKGTK